MHNMILEEEACEDLEVLTPQIALSSSSGLRRGFSFADLQDGTTRLEDKESHYNLRDDLVQHHWDRKGSTY
jgi:hypothetical protein